MTRPGSVLAAAATLVLSGAGAAHAETMPQLDFSNPLLTSQVVWGALIFVVFYLAVSRWGLPLVGEVLENRARRIEADLEQARLAKQDADRAVAELQAARRQAYAEAQKAISDAIEQAQQEAARQAREANERLEQQIAESERRIQEARTRALGALRQVATETAAEVVARLTERPADPARVAEAVGAVLAERQLASAA
jgi:F-type H+-transporting ATPase subunit b